jgi:hypothetical protein
MVDVQDNQVHCGVPGMAGFRQAVCGWTAVHTASLANDGNATCLTATQPALMGTGCVKDMCAIIC